MVNRCLIAFVTVIVGCLIFAGSGSRYAAKGQTALATETLALDGKAFFEREQPGVAEFFFDDKGLVTHYVFKTADGQQLIIRKIK